MDASRLTRSAGSWENLGKIFQGRSIICSNSDTQLIVLSDGTIVDLSFRGIAFYKYMMKFIMTKQEYLDIRGKQITDIELRTYSGVQSGECIAYFSINVQGIGRYDMCRLTVVDYHGDISNFVYAGNVEYVPGDELLQAASEEVQLATEAEAAAGFFSSLLMI